MKDGQALSVAEKQARLLKIFSCENKAKQHFFNKACAESITSAAHPEWMKEHGPPASRPWQNPEMSNQPVFPPGIFLTDEDTHLEQDEVEEFMASEGPMKTIEEIKALEEMNALDSAVIKLGWSREFGLLGIDPSDMDGFEDLCNMAEEKHSLIARSPEGEGYSLYLRKDGTSRHWGWGNSYECKGEMVGDWDSTIPIYAPSLTLLPSREKRSEYGKGELDVNNRIIVDAKILNKGPNYDNASSKYGKIWINKKFTKYVPGIGKEVRMVIGLRDCGKTHSWSCHRIL